MNAENYVFTKPKEVSTFFFPRDCEPVFPFHATDTLQMTVPVPEDILKMWNGCISVIKGKSRPRALAMPVPPLEYQGRVLQRYAGETCPQATAHLQSHSMEITSAP